MILLDAEEKRGIVKEKWRPVKTELEVQLIRCQEHSN